MTLHLIWLGSEPSAEILATQRRWQATCGQEVRLWTEADLSELPDGPWRNTTYHPAQRADLLRVALVNWFGGWYADVDCQPGTEPLPNPRNIVLAREDTRRFVNGFFYAPKGAPFLKYWIDELQESLKDDHRGSIAELTGPGALSRALHGYALEVGAHQVQAEVLVMPWGHFRHWPKSVLGNINSSGLPAARYASHIGEASWMDQNSLRADASRFALSAWRLRHSLLANAAETLRIALQNPQLSKKSLFSKQVRYALNNSTLDYLGNQLLAALEPQQVDDFKLLRTVIRSDEVVTVATSTVEIIRVLDKAHWIKLTHGTVQVWMRPRPTAYVRKPTSILRARVQ
jgi:hypothetical protein